MGKRKKTLSLNIFSLISLLLAVVMIVFFCFPFLLGIPENQSMLTQQAISGFDFLIYPFQKLFGGSSGNTLLISIELQNQANTLELLTGIFTGFSEGMTWNLDGFLLVSCAVALYNIASKMRHRGVRCRKEQADADEKGSRYSRACFPGEAGRQGAGVHQRVLWRHGGRLPPGDAAEDGVL